MTVLELDGVSRSYGRLKAVDSLSLQLFKGEIYGFLGRNGAGKTTTMRMIMGLIRPDSGAIRIFGLDPARHRSTVYRRVGSLVETATAYPNLTVWENLSLFSMLLGVGKPRIEDVVTLLKLEPYRKVKAANLSLGNKQRLALARALLGKPDLLILDEPANGLDPAGIVEMRALLRFLAREHGCAILVSSHLLDEVQHTADRVGIIHHGKLIREFSLSGQADTGHHVVTVRVKSSDVAAAQSVLASIGKVEIRPARMATGAGPRDVEPFSQIVVYAMAPLVAKTVVNAGIEMFGLESRGNDLEDEFLSLTGGVS